VHQVKVRWKPITNSQKCSLPRPSLSILPVILGYPVIKRSEEGKQNSAYDHIMKVRHNKEEPLSCQSKGDEAIMMPVRPAIKN